MLYSHIIYKAYKLKMIIQQVIKFSISLGLQQINRSNDIKNNKGIFISYLRNGGEEGEEVLLGNFVIPPHSCSEN